MKSDRILITGGYGCIGAETAKWLLHHTDGSIVICSRRVTPERSEQVFHEFERPVLDRSRLTFVEADVTNQSNLLRILTDHGITHVIHMAALQTPDCNAHRNLGMQINLGGTQNLIEAMKASGLPLARYLFASSIAVYGPRASYPQARVPMLAEPNPVNVYGTWKLAGEQLSKFFREETGVPTISLRPGVLFGPGRDLGLTSTPTTAMKCVALGIPYEIPFRSRQDYQYSPDVGAAVGNAAMEDFEGYGVFTLPGHTVDTTEIVESLRRAAADLGIESQFKIKIGKEEVPFICDLEYEAFQEAFPNVPRTPLDQAVRQSLEVFVDQAERGSLKAEDVAV